MASQGSDDSKDDSKADRIRAIAEEVGKLNKDLTHAALSSKVLKNALRMAGGIGQKAFAWVGSKLKAVQNRLAQHLKASLNSVIGSHGSYLVRWYSMCCHLDCAH